MIQSYIDEYVWGFNRKCTTERKVAYDFILKEISLNYRPGTRFNVIIKKKKLLINRFYFN